MENHCFPDDILIEIFSRTPTKTVGKFRCLSKTWRTNLSTSPFINLHLTHKPHEENIVLAGSYNSLYIVDIPSAAGHTTYRELVSRHTTYMELEPHYTWNRIVGSCNGLVLYINSKRGKLLVNPTTLEQFEVPNPPTFDVNGYRLRGFGYDSSTDDYKIVEMSCCDGGKDIHLVAVYSLKLGVWRRINGFRDTPFPVCYSSPDGVFTNGAIHWFCYDKYAIVSFNLANEVFHTLPIPANSIRAGCCGYCRILGGRLCLIQEYVNGGVTIWMMKEYGSWTKLFHIDGNYDFVFAKPLCFTKDQEIVLLTWDSEEVTDLVVCQCDIPKGTAIHHLVFPSLSFYDGLAFVDSLVSPCRLNSSI